MPKALVGEATWIQRWGDLKSIDVKKKSMKNVFRLSEYHSRSP